MDVRAWLTSLSEQGWERSAQSSGFKPWKLRRRSKKNKYTLRKEGESYAQGKCLSNSVTLKVQRNKFRETRPKEWFQKLSFFRRPYSVFLFSDKPATVEILSTPSSHTTRSRIKFQQKGTCVFLLYHWDNNIPETLLQNFSSMAARKWLHRLHCVGQEIK